MGLSLCFRDSSSGSNNSINSDGDVGGSRGRVLQKFLFFARLGSKTSRPPIFGKRSIQASKQHPAELLSYKPTLSSLQSDKVNPVLVIDQAFEAILISYSQEEISENSCLPPENELQKVGGGERVMSEHQLRVQRSLQKLDIPDWYKNTPLPAQGFLLKRNSDTTHWPGLSSKTTSLSSLGSAHSATPRSPTSNLLSPSPTPSVHTFSRWSTSRLNSNPTSTSTSPCGSARSSFNYRQPYLGWRSQERISRPRTPAERLAAGLLPQKPQPQYVPNLSEVHTSIKEVTSAIASYVSGTKGSDDRLSPGPRWDATSSRSASPRGSTGRLCWLESSFVGSRPIDVPETPVTLTSATAPDHPRSTDLYLDLTPTNRPKALAVNDS